MDVNRSLRQKMNTKSGFTLMETLLAVLILLMVTSIVTAGIPAARNAYEGVVLASNAELLLSTTISTLRNELGTATDVITPPAPSGGSNTVVTYFNGSIEARSKICLKSDVPAASVDSPDCGIVFQRYAPDANLDPTYTGGPVTRLLSEAASDKQKKLYVTYQSISFDKDKGIIEITGLDVKRRVPGASESADPVIVNRDSLTIRVFSYG